MINRLNAIIYGHNGVQLLSHAGFMIGDCIPNLAHALKTTV